MRPVEEVARELIASFDDDGDVWTRHQKLEARIADALRAREMEVLVPVARLVHEIDVWNDAVQRIIGRVPNYKWDGLEEVRALLNARSGEG